MSEPITVIKRDHHGNDVLTYTGVAIARDEASICIQASFPFKPHDLGGFMLNTGDKMLEWFYSDRYYNVFRIYDGDSDQVKGWYCNLTRPAIITADTVASDDLALDVLCFPNGEVVILDEDEYQALDLSPAEQAEVSRTLTALIDLFNTSQAPFDEGRITV